MGDGERVERASECAVQGPGQVVTGAAAKFNRKFNRRATGVQLGFRLHIHMKSQASSILSVGVLQRSRKERGMKRKRDEDDPTMNDTNYMTQFPSRDFWPQFCTHFSLIAFFDHILCTTQTADNFGQTRMWTFKESNGKRRACIRTECTLLRHVRAPSLGPAVCPMLQLSRRKGQHRATCDKDSGLTLAPTSASAFPGAPRASCARANLLRSPTSSKYNPQPLGPPRKRLGGVHSNATGHVCVPLHQEC